jgi:carbonic anhydrase/acetyltransferase-like protein (isoleucine patch superfamily)
VHLEGCIIENGAQVSSGSVVMHRAVISTGSIVAANAVVLNDTVVPPGALAVGAPAVIKENRARQGDIDIAVQAYLHKGDRFKKDLRRID